MFDLTDVDLLLSTTRAVRRRLDLGRPVERGVIEECLRLALFAPNATNAQDWRWVVVTDPGLRRTIGDVYREILDPISAQLRDARARSGDVDGLRHSGSIRYLVEHLGEVPVHVIPCVRGPVEELPLGEVTAVLGSIYPAVWSFQLALRSRGLGSVFTTAHLLRAVEIATLLGIPDEYTQTCLIPVAYTIGTDFAPAKRRPVEEVVSWNGWEPAAG
jgi:nitroreductase